MVDERAAQLQPALTPEFLATLKEAAKVVGWSVDYIEVQQFVKEVHELANVPPPNDEELIPYDHEDS